VSAVKRLHIQSLITNTATNHGRATADRVLILLRAVYNKALDLEYIHGDNPCSKLSLFGSKDRDVFLDADQRATLIHHLKDEQEHGFQSFVKLALLTGARSNNLVRMRWEQLDLTSKLWHIPADEIKNNLNWTLELTDAAITIIQQHHDNGSPYVLHDSNNPEAVRRHFQYRFTKLRQRAGLDNITIHDLRRTFGAILAINGFSELLIARALCQKSVRATPIYARLSQQAIRTGVEAVEKELSSLL
jgi:integrase